MLRWLIVAIFFVACSPRIVEYTNSNASFKNFKSYYLITLKGDHLSRNDSSNDLLNRLETAILNEMNRRGYRYDASDPDLLMRYELISSTGLNTKVNSNPYSYNSYVSSSSYTEATVLIELVDARTKKLVWQASLDTKDHLKKYKKQDPMQAIMVKLFDTYLHRASTQQTDETLLVHE